MYGVFSLGVNCMNVFTSVLWLFSSFPLYVYSLFLCSVQISLFVLCASLCYMSLCKGYAKLVYCVHVLVYSLCKRV